MTTVGTKQVTKLDTREASVLVVAQGEGSGRKGRYWFELNCWMSIIVEARMARWYAVKWVSNPADDYPWSRVISPSSADYSLPLINSDLCGSALSNCHGKHGNLEQTCSIWVSDVDTGETILSWFSGHTIMGSWVRLGNTLPWPEFEWGRKSWMGWARRAAGA